MDFEGIVANTIPLDIFWHYLEEKMADNGRRSDNIEEGKCEE